MSAAATAIFCLFVAACLAPPHWWQAIRTFLLDESGGLMPTADDDPNWNPVEMTPDHPEYDRVELSDHEMTVLADLDANTQWRRAR